MLQPVDKLNKSPAEMYARPGILSSSDKYFVQALESQKPVTIIERLNVRWAPLLNLTWLSKFRLNELEMGRFDPYSLGMCKRTPRQILLVKFIIYLKKSLH